MKKFNLSLIISLFLATQVSFAQSTFAPSGAEWNYYFNGFLGRGIANYKYTNDTVINSVTYKKMQIKYTAYFPNQAPNVVRKSIRLYRVYDDKVYDYSLYNKKETLLWLINAQKGNTYKAKALGSSTDFTVVVDSTKNITINGKIIKKTWVTGNADIYTNREIIYDNYSPMGGFNYYSCWGYVLDCGTDILCTYKDNTTNELKFSNSCDSYFTKISEAIEKWDFWVSPNPCTDMIKIDLSNVNKEMKTIDIFNSLGQQVISSKAESFSATYINTSSLEKGIYFAKISSQDGYTNNFQFIKE